MQPSSTTTAGASAENDEPGNLAEKKLRILYAEDMRELRDVAQISLTRNGHFIECVPDGAVAFEKISSNPASFDLLITDHHMPRMNGIELVTRLRAIAFPGKVMVFSSELNRDINGAYRRLQVDKILYKPVFPSALRQVLQELYAPIASIARPDDARD